MTRDMMRGLRSIASMMLLFIIYLIAMVVAAVLGHAFPNWTLYLLEVAAVFAIMFAGPGKPGVLLTMMFSSRRDDWYERWVVTAKVPVGDGWMMRRPPVPYETYLPYVEALSADTYLKTSGEVPPRLVWWLHIHGVTPEATTEFMELGVCAEDIPTLTLAGINPDLWVRLRAAGAATEWNSVLMVVWFLHFLCGTRSSVHPDDFETTVLPRTVEEVLPAFEAWNLPEIVDLIRSMNRVRTTRNGENLLGGNSGPVPAEEAGLVVACALCEQAGTRSRLCATFADLSVLGSPMGEWVNRTGLLAPYFAAADIRLPEAEQMVASDQDVSVDTLRVLRALGT